ncbi:hypothetical protein [Butyrivibrio sp. FC2001]|uniref:hypothetical protein n=1 Tax=Butyrivibrio sp. FC2001 TaxID=1280671 RepID=UPI00040BD1D6|nr:hypothetical protein [Butyrivibrio sp. FC2001]
MKPTTQSALEAWEELAFKNMRTDSAVNDLLEEIAGSKYLTSEEDDDPIWTTIRNLTNSERRRFLKGCERIRTAETK